MSLTKASYSLITGAPINVMDFGAKGDGVNDDTAAIQAAIDYATSLTGSATVYFPPCLKSQVYKITSPLNVTKPITLQGSGVQASTIYPVGFTAGQYVLNLDNAVSTSYFYTVKDMTIYGGVGNVANGMLVKNCSYSNFENLRFYDTANAIHITGTVCFTNRFTGVHTYNTDATAVTFDNFTGGGQYEFNGCTFNGAIGFAFQSTAYTDGLCFINCNFEGCRTTEILVAGTVNGLSIVGCRTEDFSGVVEFQINPTAGNSVGGVAITGCAFQAVSGSAIPIQLGGSAGVVRGFTITGNRCLYAASPNFVVLNGDGESGLIAGNYTDYATAIVNVKRPGVIVFGNEYGIAGGGGKNSEAWGLADWAVAQSTWTPIDASGATLTFTGAEGTYQLVGNVVQFWGLVTYPSTVNASTAFIGGLPITIFASGGSVARAGANISVTDSVATGLLLFPGTTTIRIQATGLGNATNAQMSSKVIYFSGSYQVS